MTPRHVTEQIITEADTVLEAMLLVPTELQARYGRTVPFTIIRIEQDIPDGDIDNDDGPVRVTAVARP